MSLDALISDACLQRPLQPLEFRLVLLRAERDETRLPEVVRLRKDGWLTNGLLGLEANMLSD
jgi:hypothetical protein